MKYVNPGGKKSLLFEDALKQYHLLIAGATGSGKSVIVNNLIYTGLFKSPAQIQFVLIDPKRVELVRYKDIPHTLVYASEHADIINALQYAMQICDSRYKEMQKYSLRKYNGSHIYVIIDEYADLITTNKKQIEPLIRRLCQVGRAANIHCIICTQSPIREIINTTVKCNIDSRFGLRTRSAQDSRNIIGKSGLETLPKYGQAYYMTPDTEQLYNINMIDDYELDKRVKWWTNQKTFIGRWKTGRLAGL